MTGYRGQTLGEYLLAAALVALVGLGGLIIVGNALQAELPALLDRIFGQVAPGTAVATAPASNPAGDSAEEIRVADGSGLLPLSLPAGQNLDFSEYPTSLLQSVETAGANGTTRKLLSQLDQLIQQLETSGEADPDSLASLKALSNQGHAIAEIEQIVEAAAASTTDPNALLRMQVSWNGQEYSVQKLSQMLGTTHWPKDYGGDTLGLASNYQWDNENQLKAFIGIYHQLESSGALADPATHATVKSLATEIAFLSETVEHVVNTTAVDAGYVNLSDLAAAELTHLKSEGICQAGGRSDSGFRCY